MDNDLYAQVISADETTVIADIDDVASGTKTSARSLNTLDPFLDGVTLTTVGVCFIRGGTGNYTLYGQGRNDTIEGGADDDVMDGGGGNNRWLRFSF